MLSLNPPGDWVLVVTKASYTTLSLRRRISRFTVSRAFFRSVKTTAVYFPFLIFKHQSYVPLGRDVVTTVKVREQLVKDNFSNRRETTWNTEKGQ